MSSINSHSFRKSIFPDLDDGRMAKIRKFEDTGRQIKTHNIGLTGYPLKVSRIEVFLGVVGYEVIFKPVYSDRNGLATASAGPHSDDV